MPESPRELIVLPSAPPEISESYSAADEEITRAITRAQENLLRQQKPDGHWCGELIVDSTLCSDYILFMHWCGEVDAQLQRRCVRHILKRQLPDGGWNIYHGGPSEINASAKAYYSLKLAGCSVDAPFMQEARATIMRRGGIPQMNTFSKLYLALLGQFPWKYLPAIPVEMVLLPRWAPFHIYKMSSWSRAMLMPLAIINHFKPTRILPGEKQLHELYPIGTEQSDLRLPRSEPFWTWRNFFLRLDDVFKFLSPLRIRPLRRRALEEAELWMLERIGEGSDGLAAVFPAMLNSLIALRALGYSKTNPVYAKAEKDFAGLFIDDPEDFRIQPCRSPIWDTAINVISLAESGVSPEHPALQKAADWLINKEVRIRGDWAVNNPHAEASGWAFEYDNIYYPDTDDTGMVLMALRTIRPRDPQTLDTIFRRALGWQLSFQCRDGGWGAFDKDVTAPWLEDMPFADHNAILDPTCSDLTARTLELLGYIGFDRRAKCVRDAIKYLINTQDEDGSWYGRWGVNYIYGTWQVLRGLRALNWNMNEPWLLKARNWLESVQHEDGGWGERCNTYDDPVFKGQGPSTASQTAWAVMGLCAFEDPYRPSLVRGIERLIRTQNNDGSWTEHETTGTGFPKVFYLKYDIYRNSWPLLALATYRKVLQQVQAKKSGCVNGAVKESAAEEVLAGS